MCEVKQIAILFSRKANYEHPKVRLSSLQYQWVAPARSVKVPRSSKSGICTPNQRSSNISNIGNCDILHNNNDTFRNNNSIGSIVSSVVIELAVPLVIGVVIKLPNNITVNQQYLMFLEEPSG